MELVNVIIGLKLLDRIECNIYNWIELIIIYNFWLNYNYTYKLHPVLTDWMLFLVSEIVSNYIFKDAVIKYIALRAIGILMRDYFCSRALSDVSWITARMRIRNTYMHLLLERYIVVRRTSTNDWSDSEKEVVRSTTIFSGNLFHWILCKTSRTSSFWSSYYLHLRCKWTPSPRTRVNRL